MTLLSDTLSPQLMALVQYTSQTARSMELKLYIIGGLVRDMLLGQPNADIDFVVEGDGILLVRQLSKQLGGQTRSHSRFGTGKWLLDAVVWEKLCDGLNISIDDMAATRLPASIDFTSARSEVYAHPTALPQVKSGDIKLDMQRRDFTINTLAIRLDSDQMDDILDYWGGLRDLEQGVIRVLHDNSFIDDPTRILRAARLEQRLGFQIDSGDEKIINAALPLLERVSGDRIRHEFEKIFAESRPEDALQRLQAMDVLAAIHPALNVDDQLQGFYALLRQAVAEPLWPELASLPDLEVPYFALLTRHLSAGDLRSAGKRLKVQRKTLNDLLAARSLLALLPELQGTSLRPSDVLNLLNPFNDRVLLIGWTLADSQAARTQIASYARHLRHIKPRLDGNDIIEKGISPGPQIGVILSKLRAAWLDGEVSDEKSEQILLDELLNRQPGK